MGNFHYRQARFVWSHGAEMVGGGVYWKVGSRLRITINALTRHNSVRTIFAFVFFTNKYKRKLETQPVTEPQTENCRDFLPPKLPKTILLYIIDVSL